jgi:hypothetical protein
MTSATMPTEIILHQRYEHINHPDLMLIHKKNIIEGLPMLKNENVSCDGCVLGKIHRDEFPSSPDRKKRDVLNIVHTGVCRPMPTRSLGFTYLEEKVMLLSTLRNSEPWWKRRQENPSKSFIQIKGEIINQGTSSNIAKIME